MVVNTVASENPDEAGRYSMDVEYGQYSVILLVEGFPPSHAGTITVYEDSQPGTLNDFLGAMSEDDLSLIHISEPTILLRIWYAGLCLKKKNTSSQTTHQTPPY
ncbi:hypothetical protein UP87_25020 [Escherichia coli]|nr:hypothetical protein UP87_25020 [Escherichia coli]